MPASDEREEGQRANNKKASSLLSFLCRPAIVSLSLCLSCVIAKTFHILHAWLVRAGFSLFFF